MTQSKQGKTTRTTRTTTTMNNGAGILLLVFLFQYHCSEGTKSGLKQQPNLKYVFSLLGRPVGWKRTTTRALLLEIPRGGGESGEEGQSNSNNSVPTTDVALESSPTPWSKSAKVATTGVSVPNEIINLVKSIVGAGVLGLPACIAAFGDSNIALVPASVLISIAGLLSSYGFVLIGRVCGYTQSISYRQAWERSVSSSTAWIPAAACFMVTSCFVLGYSMVLSDTIPSLAQTFFHLSLTRTQALLGVTSMCLLPLCLVKSLKSLGPFSFIGILGMIYTCFAMMTRYFDGTYRVPDGRFISTLPENVVPKFAEPSPTSPISSSSFVSALRNTIWNPNIFILISMLCTAFLTHFNAPKFYWELQYNTISRYQKVVTISYGISMLLFIAVASFGFMTFGSNSLGLILNNYSTSDILMSFSRIAVLVSLLCSYPLVFAGVRDGLLDILQVPTKQRTNQLLNIVTVGLLSIITTLAYHMKDLYKLFALNGATWGNALVYIFPTYMMYSCIQKYNMVELKSEIPWIILTGMIGFLMGIVGTVTAIQNLTN